MNIKKPVRLSYHAKEQIAYRGCSESEVSETIQASVWQKAELGRLECRKNFDFDKIWNDKKYKTKQVRPIFAEEEKEIVIVTVYVYYF